MILSRRLVVACLLLVLVLALGTVGYRVLVGGTWLDCLYQTVITLSTVGFSEVVPELETSPAGRIFTIGLIFAGVGILLYVISSTTAFFVEGELTDLIRRRKMEKRIAGLTNHIIVCGAGETGVHVIEELASVGEEFVVAEIDETHLEKALSVASFPYIEGDATSDEVLIQAGVEKARGIVTVLPSDKDNLFVVFAARQLNPKIRIVASGVEPSIRERLRRAGADAVVFPSHIGGLRLVSEMIRPQVVGFLDRMLRPGSKETWRIEEVEIAKGSAAAGKKLGSLDIPDRLGLPVLALIEDGGEKVTYYPSEETVLRESARLVVMTERSHVEELRKIVKLG
jgi:voltage-gated potassium channel